jgi:Ca2+-binding EF-hand superfamily protein
MKPKNLVLALSISALAGIFEPQAAMAYSQAEKNAFIKADANNDRMITPGEFRTLIEALVATGSEKAISVKKWGVYGYAFKRIDANKDGLITPAELQAQR